MEVKIGVECEILVFVFFIAYAHISIVHVKFCVKTVKTLIISAVFQNQFIAARLILVSAPRKMMSMPDSNVNQIFLFSFIKDSTSL